MIVIDSVSITVKIDFEEETDEEEKKNLLEDISELINNGIKLMR